MLCQRCSGQTLGVFLPTFLLLLYFVSNIKSTSNWSMHAGLPHRNGKRNPAAYVTCLLMFQGKTGWKWNTFRNIWFKRKIWEELISRLYQYVSQLKFDKNSLNGILQPHSRFCIKWSKLARTKFKYTSSPLTVHSFFCGLQGPVWLMPMLFFKHSILKCRFFPLVYCAIQVTANCKRLKLEDRPLLPGGLETLRLCWFKKSRTGWPLWGNLLCWLLLHFWQTSFEVSFGYKLFEVRAFRNRELFLDSCVTLLSVAFLFSGMSQKKKIPKPKLYSDTLFTCFPKSLITFTDSDQQKLWRRADVRNSQSWV